MKYLVGLHVLGVRNDCYSCRSGNQGRVDHKLCCGPKPLYIRKRLCTAEEISDALQDLVSGNYDVTAQTISELIMKENGIEEAVKAIEDYISEG